MNAPVEFASSAIDLKSEPPFRVGGARVDPVSREATLKDASERLRPQVLKVLIALVRRRNQLVTREQLVEQCWDGRFIGDDVINRAISTLRQFSERAGGFTIETVPRSGYRLIEAKRTLLFPRRWLGLGAASAVAAFAGVLLLPHLLASNSPPPAPTIELLPFATDSGDPVTRELVSAAHDSLADKLSQTQFSVILPKQGAPSRAADFVISGSVRDDGDKVLIAVRMEQSARHIVVYSHEFESARGAAEGLPEQVGGSVAGSIGWAVPLLTLEQRHPSDPAITAQLFQEVDWDALSLYRGYQTARRVAARDPSSALAQLLLAFNSAFVVPQLALDERAEAVATGRRAADQAQILAPEYGDSFIPWCLLHSSARIQECEDRLRAGMRVDPDAAFVGWFLADRLREVGRFAEASDLAASSLAHDRFVGTKVGLAARMFEATGNAQMAETLYRNARRWWPEKVDFFYDRLSGMIDRGDFDAMVAFERAEGPTNWPQGYRSVAPLASAVRANSPQRVRQFCAKVTPASLHAIMCVLALARVGDMNTAFAFADRIYPDRVGRSPEQDDSIWLQQPYMAGTEYIVGPGAAELRRDPRYLALAERTGLLAYWRSGRLPDFCRGRGEPICIHFRAHPQA